MKYLHIYLVLSLLLLGAFGCGSTEDPDDDIEVPVDETLVPSGSIQGEVQVIDGVAIQVRLLKEGQLISQTDADGSFKFEEIEVGDYTLQITAKGYEMVESSVTVEDGKVAELAKTTLQESVEPVSHLTGKLTDTETGDPLSGVLVKLKNESGDEYETITSEVGTYTFANLPVNQAFTLTVMHDGYEGKELEVQAIPSDETSELDIVLTAIPETVVLDPSEGLGIGSKAPGFELPDGNNVTHKLTETLSTKNVVIVFYRGSF